MCLGDPGGLHLLGRTCWEHRLRENLLRQGDRNGGDLNAQDKKGRALLYRATIEGRADAAEALLVVGADPEMLTRSDNNAFEIARLDAKYPNERT